MRELGRSPLTRGRSERLVFPALRTQRAGESVGASSAKVCRMIQKGLKSLSKLAAAAGMGALVCSATPPSMIWAQNPTVAYCPDGTRVRYGDPCPSSSRSTGTAANSSGPSAAEVEAERAREAERQRVAEEQRKAADQERLEEEKRKQAEEDFKRGVADAARSLKGVSTGDFQLKGVNDGAFGLKGVDTNDNLGLKDGPTAVPLPYASNGTAWTAQITDPTVKRFAGRISAVVPPPPIPPKEAPVSWSQIYMNQDALMKSADRLMAAWEMAGPVGSSVEAPLKVIMIAGKTFIAGEDGAALYLAKKDQTYEDALRYLKSPTQSQQFARLVQAIREGRPVPSADPTMVKAARALADPKLGNSGATIAWDSMMSPEALSAMLRKACIEVGSEAIADKAGNVLTHMSQRKAVFDEVRLERSQAVHMMKLATTTEAQREQLRIVIEHANQVIALTYRVERVEQYAAGQFIGEATDKLATALFGPETRTQEAH